MQIVPQQFIDMARGDVRSHSWGCRISFTKAYDDDITFFTLNQSLLNGGDILGTTADNPIAAWDYYEYADYTDRITYMSWDRSLEFPYSIVSARADFQLANTDKYFTPDPQPIPVAPQITNHSTNPSFETGSGTVEVRRNLAVDPAATKTSRDNGTFGFMPQWYGGLGGVGITSLESGSSLDEVDTYIRKTWTVAPSAAASELGFGLSASTTWQTSKTGYVVTPGQVYTISVYARVNLAITPATKVNIRVRFADVDGVPLPSTTIVAADGIDGWQRVSCTVTVPAGAVYLNATVESGLWQITAGDTFDATGLLVERIGTVLPYFDGDTNDGFDTASLTPAWTGTANNSASVLNGVVPVGADDSATGNSVVWLSSDSPNHGSRFVRGLIKNSSAVAFNCRDTSGTTAEVLTGSMYVRSSRAVSGTARWYKQTPFASHTIGTVPLPSNSWYEIRDTRAVSSDDMGLSLIFNPSPFQAGDIIDIDNHMVVKGNYTGVYRDGYSHNWHWNDAPNASTSTGDDPSWIPPVLPLQAYILPKRPVRLLSGFRNMIIPQFVGLTQGMPSVNDREGTATFTALDFLTQIYEMPIRNTIAMNDVRTDEVLAQIFSDFGLTPSQYDLAKARNKIPFLFFEREQQTAGDVIRKLMEAEGGMLWLGEDGIIRFKPRLEQPSVPVYELNDSEIVDISVSEDTQIINQVVFSGELRTLAGYQNVFTKPESDRPNVIMAGSTGVFSADLKDPCIDVVQPIQGEQAGVSWFIASRPDGTPVTSGVSVVSVELKTNSYDVVFSNSNVFDVNISQMELFGNPAKVYGTIDDKVVEYQPSIDKYEANPIFIKNNFIQTESQMQSLALTILDDYAEYASIINAEIKGNPALQLGDIVEVNYKQYTGEYRIIGISSSLQQGKATQNVKLRSYTPRDWFVLNKSQLNGSDLLAP